MDKVQKLRGIIDNFSFLYWGCYSWVFAKEHIGIYKS